MLKKLLKQNLKIMLKSMWQPHVEHLRMAIRVCIFAVILFFIIKVLPITAQNYAMQSLEWLYDDYNIILIFSILVILTLLHILYIVFIENTKKDDKK